MNELETALAITRGMSSAPNGDVGPTNSEPSSLQATVDLQTRLLDHDTIESGLCLCVPLFLPCKRHMLGLAPTFDLSLSGMIWPHEIDFLLSKLGR